MFREPLANRADLCVECVLQIGDIDGAAIGFLVLPKLDGLEDRLEFHKFGALQFSLRGLGRGVARGIEMFGASIGTPASGIFDRLRSEDDADEALGRSLRRRGTILILLDRLITHGRSCGFR